MFEAKDRDLTEGELEAEKKRKKNEIEQDLDAVEEDLLLTFTIFNTNTGTLSTEETPRKMRNGITKPKVKPKPREPLFKCTVCSKGFNNSKALRIHGRQHESITSRPKENKRYSCDTCGKGFNFISKLQRHQIIHIEVVKPYNCDECGKGFKREVELKKHNKIHTGLYFTTICKSNYTHMYFL